MRGFTQLSLGLLGSAALVSAADAVSDVVDLKTDTFKDFVKEHDLVLAEFFAPWCGHCKALAPEYEVAATELKEKNIPLVKVDCTAETDLCSEYEVGGYPTIKVFRGLENPKPYNGARKSGAIVSYMTKQSLPAVSTVTADNIEEFKTMDKIVLIGYLSEDDKANNEILAATAEALRDDYLWGLTTDADLAKAEGAKQPSIALYKPFDEKKDVFDEKFSEESITNFAKTSSTPLVGEVGPETYSGYMSAGIPLAYYFAETEEEREAFAESIKPAAKKHKGVINIATIDAKAFGAHANNLNLDPEKFPAFAIQDTENNKKFPFDQAKEITEKDISEFIQNVLDGKVEPSVKSEPIPETQEGPVTVIVAHNYQEVVIDNDKDVLVEFYAPWCGHCKALAPKYDELAGLYAANEDFASKVTIAKVDATANDVPDEIRGFPTIKLFPAGAKGEPVDYSGSRTVEDLAEFIKENGKYKIDVLPEAESKPAEGGDVTSSESSSSTSAPAAEETEDKEKDHDEL